METEHTDTQVHLVADHEGGITYYPTPEKSVDAVHTFLIEFAGISHISAEALLNTPRRYFEAFRELMGLNDPTWSFTVFESECDEMVICKDIDFVSLCEHHMMPFIGRAHVGYIPQGQIAGLSKLARAVKSKSRGLWTQEHLTLAIANFLEEALQPIGVGVVLQAEHTCMSVRGIKTPKAKTTTSAMRGAFREKSAARAEFLELIK